MQSSGPRCRRASARARPDAAGRAAAPPELAAPRTAGDAGPRPAGAPGGGAAAPPELGAPRPAVDAGPRPAVAARPRAAHAVAVARAEAVPRRAAPGAPAAADPSRKSASPPSAAAEGGLPLLDERRRALDEVLASAECVLQLRLEVELAVEIAVDELVERALRARVRACRTGGELLGQAVRLVHQPLVRVHPVDEPPVERLLGGDPLAQQRHLERAGATH